MNNIKKRVFLTRAEPNPNGDDATCMITTNGDDRDGDVIDPMGIDLTAYKLNPVVLFGHNYDDLPVGKCTRLEVTPTGIRASWNFLPGDERAQRVANAWKHGVLNATSVGLRLLETKPRGQDGGRTYTRTELLEFSIVPVPANPQAVRTLKAYGLWNARVAKSGRALSRINEEHLRDALNHTTSCSEHLCQVLAALDGDDDVTTEGEPYGNVRPVDRGDDDEEVLTLLGPEEDLPWPPPAPSTGDEDDDRNSPPFDQGSKRYDVRREDVIAACRQVASEFHLKQMRAIRRGMGGPLDLDRVRRRVVDVDVAELKAALAALPGVLRAARDEALADIVTKEAAGVINRLRGRLD